MYTRKGLVLCAVLLTAAIALTALAPVLPAHAEGGAPVAQNLELTTYRNVSVGGRLSAVDPDGGTLTYQITTEPTKGEIELTDDGRFVYTPGTNRRGRDYFGFKATDADGKTIARFKREHMAPGEMEQVALPPQLLKQARGPLTLRIQEV